MKLLSLLPVFWILTASVWAKDNGVIYSPELVKNAELGDAISQCNLGICYAEGIGVTKDEKQAVKWYRNSAEKGNAYAQVLLGVCLSNHRLPIERKAEA